MCIFLGETSRLFHEFAEASACEKLVVDSVLTGVEKVVKDWRLCLALNTLDEVFNAVNLLLEQIDMFTVNEHGIGLNQKHQYKLVQNNVRNN